MPPPSLPESRLRPIYFLLCAVALLAACAQGVTQDGGLQPVPAPVQEPPRTFVYECSDGYRFVARIEGEKAWLFLPEQTVSLPQVPAASGAKYMTGC
jgi:membrane-bound inhibitor of C-type lysozyme